MRWKCSARWKSFYLRKELKLLRTTFEFARTLTRSIAFSLQPVG
jgi:hypothetical protein